jgi:Uma2 family endonuclease
MSVASMMSIDEFLKLPSSECLRELVKGRVIESKLRTPRHGQICAEIIGLLWTHLRETKTGKLVAGNAAVVLNRAPDCVRGPDIAIYHPGVLAADASQNGQTSALPEFVLDVLDVHDHWYDVIEKALEYLHAGVKEVCIVDPKKESIALFRPGQPPKLFHAADEFRLPEIFGDFHVAVKEFFA